MRLRHILPFLFTVFVLMLSSCYQHRSVHRRAHNTPLTERTIDSLSFFQTHHYTNNYNFVVRADSLVLLRQMPEEEVAGMNTDSFCVYRGDHVAVADIKIVPADSIDSVWVQLANDTSAFGWTHEKTMLPRVMPDDPISQFISAFSDSHLIIFLIVVGLFGASYLLWKVFKKKHTSFISTTSIPSIPLCSASSFPVQRHSTLPSSSLHLSSGNISIFILRSTLSQFHPC